MSLLQSCIIAILATPRPPPHPQRYALPSNLQQLEHLVLDIVRAVGGHQLERLRVL